MSSPRDQHARAPLRLPETLPLLPVRDIVVFPSMLVPLMVSRDISAQAVSAALGTPERLVLLATQREEGEERLRPDGVYRLGTVGTVVKMRRLSDGRMKVVVQGASRVRLGQWVEESPCVRVRVEPIDSAEERSDESQPAVERLMKAVRDDFQKYVQSGKAQSPEGLMLSSGIDDPGRLADLVAANLALKCDVAQGVLERLDPVDRLREVGRLLRTEVEILEVQATIQSRAKEEMSRTQREYFLREQLRQIQSELGGTDASSDNEQLRARIDAAGLPQEASREATRQLRRLEQTHADSAEAGVIRTYLEWLVDVPWRATTDDSLELARAALVLDEDHHGLEDVKDRILEYLGVLRLRRDRLRSEPQAPELGVRAPVLCFVGPPGVGKTSLGRSISRALGRRFVRISLGGVRDEAEIRGHRRTYVGALPGRILQAMKQAGTVNPVFVLDEIDKLGSDFRGDPSAALLEVLDPEQNGSFRDHYLGVEYDLSRVLFIATANALDPVPRPLLDRMEIVRLSGYSEEEKVAIAERHILARQLANAGLDTDGLAIGNDALRRIIAEYTREAGLRELERQVGHIARKVARQTVEARDAGRPCPRIEVSAATVREYLGPPPYARIGRQEARDEIGAATGLAWTPYGGEVLNVEAQWMPGRGTLILTGQLGDVMKESAMTALSFARARAAELGLKEGFYSEREIHIHVPAGAVQKDGPSAGVTMAAALMSLMTGRPVLRDVAMTGEITLRGHVLGVGGIKEKLLAAARAGARVVLLPEANASDVESLTPTWLGSGLKIVYCGTMQDVLDHALGPRVSTLEAAVGGAQAKASAEA